MSDEVAALVAPGCFVARFATSAGNFTIEAHRGWAPVGVDRLYSLLRASFYDDTRVYRMVEGWVAQFGYSGSPRRQHAQSIIPDDQSTSLSNLRGMLAYSAAYEASMQHATNRTTELYVNLADHPQLDALGFTPIARVTSGMESVVDAFYSGYGEMMDACSLHGFLPCNGPVEARVLQEGNDYLDADFPLLTRIISAVVVLESSGSDADARATPRPPPSPSPPPTDSGGTALLVGAIAAWLCSCWAISVWLRSEAMQRDCRRRCGILARSCEYLFGVQSAAEHRGTGLSSSTRAEGVTLELASYDSAAQHVHLDMVMATQVHRAGQDRPASASQARGPSRQGTPDLRFA